ncbi:protein D2-like [Dermacentor variabilis]|uniref:protein D2-like n=1 Tax=Dermacentor variabilis TaxID=34621 RepID=UPI003F5C6664
MQLAVAAATILVLFTCRATELDSRQMELLDKANKSRIAPDLIEAIPGAIFEARFEAGPIAMGNRFTPEQASAAPSAIEFPRTAGTMYTITMLDPDAPSMSDPKFGPILHWLVVNVEAGDVNEPVNYERGNELFGYRGPKPPAGSGPHRYVFLAYKQQNIIESPQMVPFDKRKNFKIAEFTKEHNLGNPIALNYFLAENAI